MAIKLDANDVRQLEEFVARKPKPSKRQVATAILEHLRGSSLQEIVDRTAITHEEISALFSQLDEHGLAGVGLAFPSEADAAKHHRSRRSTIERTADVCGNSARVSGTRIPVWVLVEARELGVSEAQILLDYPGLSALNLVDAWSYAAHHKTEIDADILRNEVA